MANFIHCLGVVWGFLVFIRFFFVGDKDSANRAKTQVYLRFSEVQPIFRQRSSLNSNFMRRYALPSASSVQSAIKGLLKSDLITQEDGATVSTTTSLASGWLRSINPSIYTTTNSGCTRCISRINKIVIFKMRGAP